MTILLHQKVAMTLKDVDVEKLQSMVEITICEEYLQIRKMILRNYQLCGTRNDNKIILRSGMVSASLLLNVGFTEYKNAAGEIKIFEKLIELINKEEIYK